MKKNKNHKNRYKCDHEEHRLICNGKYQMCKSCGKLSWVKGVEPMKTDSDVTNKLIKNKKGFHSGLF